jgi:hypothetical protein
MSPVRSYCGEFFSRLFTGVPSRVLSSVICLVLNRSAGVEIQATPAASDPEPPGLLADEQQQSLFSAPPALTSCMVNLENVCRSLCTALFGDGVSVGGGGMDSDCGVTLAQLSALISQYDAPVVRADKARSVRF